MGVKVYLITAYDANDNVVERVNSFGKNSEEAIRNADTYMAAHAPRATRLEALPAMPETPDSSRPRQPSWAELDMRSRL